MKIRRYTCNNMQEALLKVKMDLGSEAVIMNSRKVRRKGIIGLFTKPMIEIVAAIDDDYAKPSRSQARTAPSPNVNGNFYYENAFPTEQPSGTFPQAPAYGREQAAYQPKPPAMPEVQPAVPPKPQYPYPTMQETQQAYRQPAQPMQYQPQQPQVQPQIRPVQQANSVHTANSLNAGNPVNAANTINIANAVNTVKTIDTADATTSVNTADMAHTPNAAQKISGLAASHDDIHEDEHPKLVELENKVKSMETMLEQIYRSVKENSYPAQAESDGVKTEVPASSEPDSMGEVRKTLAELDLESDLVDRIVERVMEKGGRSLKTEAALALAARIMTGLLGEPDTIKLRSDGRPQVVIFVGPTGVGKTTTLAKIAADFTLNKQKKVGLITADTYRIAAVEQLKTYSEILNIPVLVVYSPSEFQEAVRTLSDRDLILIDTAGRSHRNKSHFDELKTLVNSVEADEAYLVLSANTSKHTMKEILEYYSFIKDYKLLFTKLDEAPVPGVIVNARYLTGKPLSYTTAGQSVPDDLNVANPRAIVSSLLGFGMNQ